MEKGENKFEKKIKIYQKHIQKTYKLPHIPPYLDSFKMVDVRMFSILDT